MNIRNGKGGAVWREVIAEIMVVAVRQQKDPACTKCPYSAV